MIFNIAVCDDSAEYGVIVTDMIKEATIKNNIDCNISTYDSGKKLVQAFKENEFDIIFLDMEMPELNGIETGLLVREISKNPVIFYLTSHKDYAYDSYKVKAKNYILKPINLNIMESVLLECFDEKKAKSNYLDVKDFEGVIHRIPIKSITHILRKKEDRKLHIYTLDAKEIVIVQTLESIEKELAKYDSFTRSSKSCIVNLESVRAIIKNEIYFSDNTIEYASRRCLSGLLSKFNL